MGRSEPRRAAPSWQPKIYFYVSCSNYEIYVNKGTVEQFGKQIHLISCKELDEKIDTILMSDC